jgi:hypothetical protein
MKTTFFSKNVLDRKALLITGHDISRIALGWSDIMSIKTHGKK